MTLLLALVLNIHMSSAQPADSAVQVLDWVMLKDVKVIRSDERDSLVVPSSILKSNHKLVEISGFLLPPNTDDENTEYELTEESHLSCLHTDDDDIVKLHLRFKKREALQFNPVKIRGTFNIVSTENGEISYEITNAEIR